MKSQHYSIGSGTKMFKINAMSGFDAVFLPGKIHGSEHQVYIIYFNDCANNGYGSWEIEVVDSRILNLYEEVGGDADRFFDLLPDWFQGEWYYCDNGMDGYDDYEKAYPTADFIYGRDGGKYEEMMFLVNWANGMAHGGVVK